jgi:ubiquinone/menaquinone biosynthesis C-methylase UbiE
MITQEQNEKLYALPGWAEYVEDGRYKITKEQVISELQRVAKKLGYTPTRGDFIKHASVSVQPIIRLFVSWNTALKAAGMKPNNVKDIPKEQVISELKRVAKKLGRTPTHEDFNKHASVCAATAERLFDTWNKALVAANLKVNLVRGITKEQVLAELKRVAKKLGRTPTQEDFITFASMSVPTVRGLCVTYNAAVEAAGLTVNHKMYINKEQVIAELKRVAKKLGRTPTIDDFDKHASMNSMTAAKLFGSWNKALAYVGLRVNNVIGITKEQVLAELKRVAKKLGRTPTRDDFNKYASLSKGTVENSFGTWNKALVAADLKPNQLKRRTL